LYLWICDFNSSPYFSAALTFMQTPTIEEGEAEMVISSGSSNVDSDDSDETSSSYTS
uniref:Ovule protein n=1 Tax=Gongylonema pulchrum TaxID=637853 RepID=A0A183CVK8_9BILA